MMVLVGNLWRQSANTHNGLAENRVGVVKRTLRHMMEHTLSGKLLSYAKMQVLLQEAATIINDRPVRLERTDGGQAESPHCEPAPAQT